MSVRLPARSEQHDSAHMRMRREDVQVLRSQPGAMSSPVIALFSTRNPGEPVSFRPSETLYVRLPEDTEISDTETTEPQELDDSDKDKREDTEQPKQPKQAEQSEQKPHRRRRAQYAWIPLRLVAHHSYVVGMKVSGIVHRAIVRLEFDK